MLKTIKVVAVSTLLALGLVAGHANADPVSGGITVTGGIPVASLPAAPSTSVVSALLGLTPDPGISASCSGDFLVEASCGLIAGLASWTFAGPFPDIIVVDGWTFDLTGAGAPVGVALVCGLTSCADSLSISLSGIVSGNGYTPTAFTGFLALTGSCTSSNGASCTGGGYTAGYTYSLSATGRSVPEPATLGLVAIALLGLGFLRRKVS